MPQTTSTSFLACSSSNAAPMSSMQNLDEEGKKGGQFYTPRDVARLMVRLVKPQENNGTGIPACILIMRREGYKPQDRKGKVLFINADAEYQEGEGRKITVGEFLDSISRHLAEHCAEIRETRRVHDR